MTMTITLTITLVAIILVLSVLLFLEKRDSKKHNNDLLYVENKLRSIIQEGTDERLKVHTESEGLRELLTAINELLDYKQKSASDFAHSEITIRKMLSNISHDLKTPLTVILGYVETLRINLPSDDKNIKNIDKVISKTNEVIDLMDKFFDLAKLESGDKDIPLTRVNISEACRRNILSFYDISNRNGIKVDIDIPDTDLYAFSNSEALDRIISNLVSNALKYGNEGGVLGLKLSESDNRIKIEIWDKGKGIRESDKDKIFERMYTLEDSRNKSYQGSGLGLTITKRLVEKINGDITLESKPYDKTSFVVAINQLTY